MCDFFELSRLRKATEVVRWFPRKLDIGVAKATFYQFDQRVVAILDKTKPRLGIRNKEARFLSLSASLLVVSVVLIQGPAIALHRR